MPQDMPPPQPAAPPRAPLPDDRREAALRLSLAASRAMFRRLLAGIKS